MCLMICSGMFHHPNQNNHIDQVVNKVHIQVHNQENISVRYDAVTGEPMEAIDIPDGNGGFVQVDYCKSTGGWFLDKEELSALRSIPGIVQIIQTYSSN